MKQNYCEIKNNKIYVELFDELLDEELNMNKQEDNESIKHYIDKKIKSSNYIKISESFINKQEILEDVISKITLDIGNNYKLQGNTLLIYANDSTMYELFYMEDLTKQMDNNDLNEFASIINTFHQPICWGCGIFKTSYLNGKLIEEIITKQDISKIFIQNFYHIGIMINIDDTMIEIEFTGENPFNIIGNNFTQSDTVNILNLNIVPYFDKQNNFLQNNIATKLFGIQLNGRIFLTLVCPDTNKKYWDITSETIKNILMILENKNYLNNFNNEKDKDQINVNPFYYIKKAIYDK